ncbi:hypothetical protein CC78DRAFT_538578 [Lojkania enalia]|uniref:Uncharacterized protein n=1 Tax=Lojkania enalia TaxID=147567 RepID=A0A9P4TRZ7_9PLEO|nr:hypothetical protein CC78DRAFT_538578 [Didymosphaeria enalia]
MPSNLNIRNFRETKVHFPRECMKKSYPIGCRLCSIDWRKPAKARETLPYSPIPLLSKAVSDGKVHSAHSHHRQEDLMRVAADRQRPQASKAPLVAPPAAWPARKDASVQTPVKGNLTRNSVHYLDAAPRLTTPNEATPWNPTCGVESIS